MPPMIGMDESTIMPPPVDLTLATVGGRLFYVRRMLRVSRLTVEQIAGMSYGHYGRFEYGRKVLSQIQTAYRIIGAFYRLGVSVDFHWLVLGEAFGDEPVYNERFWVRYPKERPRLAASSLAPVLPTEPPPEDPEMVPVPPRSGVGVKLVAGPPRLKILAGNGASK